MNARQRRAALLGGLGLLAMAVLAGYANLGVIAKPTEVSTTQFQVAGVLMGFVAVLDVVVALALVVVLEGGRLSAALRIGYALVLGFAVLQLLTSDTDNATRAAAFHRVFDPALGVFGLHLVALSVALGRTRLVLAAFVAVAGLGYVIDAVAHTQVGAVTFVGELVLMGWLLVVGLRRSSPSLRQPIAEKPV